jgi:hypothetical protein
MAIEVIATSGVCRLYSLLLVNVPGLFAWDGEMLYLLWGCYFLVQTLFLQLPGIVGPADVTVPSAFRHVLFFFLPEIPRLIPLHIKCPIPFLSQ